MLPAVGALLGWRWWRGRAAPAWAGLGLVTVAAFALVYTTPWDNYLVSRGVWSYRADRVAMAWRIGYVPLEEYFFFVLQPIFTGLCLLCFYPPRAGLGQFSAAHRWTKRSVGGAAAIALGVLGGLFLAEGGRSLNAGLILACGAPPLALHWFYGGDTLWDARRAAFPALVLSTGYLWLADRLAIGAGVWSISARYSTGWTLGGLPLEEALFFVVTNLLIIQALLLFFRLTSRLRAPVPSPP